MIDPNKLVKCEECGEMTHPRSDGAERCPKHLTLFKPTETVFKSRVIKKSKKKRIDSDAMA